MAITTTREQRRRENHERALAAYMEHHAWKHWTIPAFGGERMAVEGCRAHDILISSREGNER